MSSAIISGCGKLNTNGGGESNLSYLNIISIPVAVKTLRTRLMFFSNQEVNNINDLVDVINFYKTYNQPIIVAGGDLVVPQSEHEAKRYAVVDLFITGTNQKSVNISYRTSATVVTNTYKLFDIGIPEPADWIYINLKL